MASGPEIVSLEREHLLGVIELFAGERWSYADDELRTWRALTAPGTLSLVALSVRADGHRGRRSSAMARFRRSSRCLWSPASIAVRVSRAGWSRRRLPAHVVCGLMRSPARTRSTNSSASLGFQASAFRDHQGSGPRREGTERMAEQVPVVCDVLATIEARNWDRLARILHPEVHWTTAAEDELHGPDAVIRRLSGDPPPAPPSYHEVRDGLVWRWIDCPG